MTSNYFCLRHLILGSFVLLGISGLIVCSATSYFIHQNNKYDYNNTQFDNIQGPPATLLVMGILTSTLSIYFWFVMDHKYNSLQFIIITFMLIIVAFIEGSMGIWALVMHERLDAMLSTSLEQSVIISKIRDNMPLSNITIVKLNCCGYNETILDLRILSSRECCDFNKMDIETRIMCNDIHGTECKHLIINRNRSILHQIFLLALCSVFFLTLIITSVIFYAKFLRKHAMRQRQSLVVAKPSAPHALSY